MGLFDTIFGNDKASPQQQRGQSDDEQAVARYRYMLKTAAPETIEEAHAEAFAKLTPEQRDLVLQSLSENAPSAERAAAAQGGADPNALARLVTRAEMRQPGTMERTLGRTGGGVGLGGIMAGGLLSTIAGTVIGSMIAQQFFANDAQASEEAGDANNTDQQDSETNEDYTQDDSSDFDSGGFDDV